MILYTSHESVTQTLLGATGTFQSWLYVASHKNEAKFRPSVPVKNTRYSKLFYLLRVKLKVFIEQGPVAPHFRVRVPTFQAKYEQRHNPEVMTIVTLFHIRHRYMFPCHYRGASKQHIWMLTLIVLHFIATVALAKSRSNHKKIRLFFDRPPPAKRCPLSPLVRRQ